MNEQACDSKEYSRKKTIIYFTLTFIIISFFAFFWLLIYGKTLLHKNDGFDQWYPLLVYLRNAIKGGVSGNGFGFWSWQAGLGGDLLGSFYSVFCDPFSYIAAAFPASSIDIGHGVAIFCRLYCAGIAMSLFLRYQKYSYKISILGGVSYAFCAYALWGLQHPFFLNAMILFPLLILGVEKIEKEQRPVLFILAVALSLITCMYFAYMSAIYTIAYVLIKYLLLEKHRPAICLKKILSIVAFALIGGCISAPFSIPQVWTILQASISTGAAVPLFFDAKEYLTFLPSLLTNAQFFGNFSATAVGGLFIALLPAIILAFCKKTARLPVIMFFASVICALMPKACSLLNGMSYATGRWCYIFAFFFIWAGLSGLDVLVKSDSEYVARYQKGLLITWIVFVASCVLAGVLGFLSTLYLNGAVISFGIGGIGSVILCRTHSKTFAKTESKLLLLVCLNLICMWMIIWSPFSSGYFFDFLDRGVAFSRYSNSLLQETTNISDEDFYRVDYIERVERNTTGYDTQYGYISNEQMFSNVRTAQSFYSTRDTDWLAFDEALCNNANYYTRVKTFGTDNRSRINFLLGMRYFISTESNMIYAGDEFSYYGAGSLGNIYRNQTETSLGYVYQNVIRESSWNQLFYTDREQAMMQAAVVPDDYNGIVPEVSAEDLLTQTYNCNYTIVSTSGVEFSDHSFIVPSNGGRIEIDVPEVTDSEIYVYFGGFHRHVVDLDELRLQTLGNDTSRLDRDTFNIRNISYEDHENFTITLNCNGITKQLRNLDGNNQAMPDVSDYLSNLGYHDRDGVLRVSIVFNTAGVYSYDDFEILGVSQFSYDNQVQDLSANRLIIYDMESDYIVGNIDSDGGLLFLSIVNNGGWKVYVDGEETEIIPNTNIGFMGVEVPSGLHSVELRYQPVGFRHSIVVCFIGIVCTIGVVLFLRRKTKGE